MPPRIPEYDAIIPGLNGELFEKNNIEDLKEEIIKVRTRQLNTPIQSIYQGKLL